MARLAFVLETGRITLSGEAKDLTQDKNLQQFHPRPATTRAFEKQVYFASANRIENDEYLYGPGNSACRVVPINMSCHYINWKG